MTYTVSHGIGHNGANAWQKRTFHSSVLSPELSDMSDRLISDQEKYNAHLLYIAQELSELKTKVARYRPVITVFYIYNTCIPNADYPDYINRL